MTTLSLVLLVVLGCGLLFLILGIILLVSLLTSKNQGTRTLGWVLLACGVIAPVPLLIIGLLTVRMTEPRMAPVEVRRSIVQAAPRTLSGESTGSSTVIVHDPTSSALPSAWLPQVDQEFEADIYHSRVSAATALGQQLATAVQDIDRSSERSPMCVTIGDTLGEQFNSGAAGLGNAEAVSEAIAKQLRTALPGVNVSTKTPRPQDEGTLVIELSLPDWQRQPGISAAGSKDVLAGTIKATVALPDSDVERSVQFIDKPWVEFASGSQVTVQGSSNATGGTWRIFRCQKLAATRKEAQDLALNEADKLFVQLNPSNSDEITRAIRNGNLLADRFTQRLSRPYGDVYREAILIDVNPSLLSRLQRQAEVAQVKAASNITWRLLGFVVMMAIVSVVYLILNSLTRGYYRMPIGIIVGTIVLLVSLIVLILSMTERSDQLKPTRPLPRSACIDHVTEIPPC